jgi:uncharacterized protein (TIGR03790 family)
MSVNTLAARAAATVFGVAALFLLLFLSSRTSETAQTAPTSPAPQAAQTVSVAGNQPPVSPERVLVVMNADSVDSREITEYYVTKRRIPEKNILRILCPDATDWKRAEYRERLERPIQERLGEDLGIEYIVLTKSIPYRISDFGEEGGFSTDTMLATCLLPNRPESKRLSPYFQKNTRFSRKTTGLVLVTRLDGLTRADAKSLVDTALAARPAKGPFYLRDSFVLDMRPAHEVLTARGFETHYIAGANNTEFPNYAGEKGPYMAHYGAGPHDQQYSSEEYAALRFLPGALGEITWSVSAADIRKPEAVGNIATMTQHGASGAQGFVSEPFANSVSRPEIVLDRYTHGYNLAESFAMGTPYLPWKQIVLGDPLCAPYADSPAKPTNKNQ